MNLKQLLSQRVEAALDACGTPGQALVQTSSRPEFGDYQANGVMAVAKRHQRVPRELAAEVCEALDLSGIAETPEIAGPGFINIRLSADFLAAQLATPLSVQQSTTPERVVVDYSAPNLAKEMHVGHLRSTIIGDAMVRVNEALGHDVLRQNHVGDWGTQFGMLLTYMQDTGANSEALEDLETFYRASKQAFDADPDFATRSRAMVVALQSGDADARAAWERFIDISLDHCQSVYDRLGVKLTREDVCAESFYNPQLPGIIQTLDNKGLLTESEGAQCVFLPEFKGKDGTPLPLIVQKTGGGYLYATTDLAAIEHRSGLQVDRVYYFVDVRQSLHFKQVFAVAKAAGLMRESSLFEHMPFGAMLGNDGKPFKTREGDVVKLTALLDEAVERAANVIATKNPDLDPTVKQETARAVGIGAVKYADLSKNRTSDYVFDWEQMLAFDGNTAPYLQYAVVRIRSVFRQAGIAPEETDGGAIALVEDAERALAVQIMRLQEVLDQVAYDGYAHFLCNYLYDTATRFSQFYERCDILRAESQVRASRLALCAQTLRALLLGLELLGIEAPEQM